MWMAQARRRAAITLVAVSVFAYFQHYAFVSGSPASFRPSSRETTRDVSCKGTAGLTGQKIIIKLPKAPGFSVYDVKQNTRDTMECKPKGPLQKRRFTSAIQSGQQISDVYVRFEGKTPWKKVGDVAHSRGNFAEAVKCQYNLIFDNAHHIYRKIRFLSHGDQIMQFGYTNEKAEIVQMDSGFYPLGVEPWEIETKLRRSGFRPELKPRAWRGTLTNIRDSVNSKKDFYRTKPWLLRRKEQTLLSAHKWYNPDKAHEIGPPLIRGRSKRGIIQNPSMGGPYRRKTWKKKHSKRKKFR